TLVQQPSSHTLEDEYTRVTRRAIAAESSVTSGLAGVSLATAFPAGNPLADQLKMVARLIGARQTLGAKRQVFMVSLGGFDLHDNLIAQQPVLMQRLSEAMTSFYNATVELGLADKVTAFTASDFGRTLTSNGDGSDHGWGGHHLVVGGAVKGQAFYGSAPPVSVTNTAAPEDQWHVGQGRLLPT
ncbi:MAG TPA: Tat pathway signal protein, partial [Comamonadaceae bacterium]|nr:Tat pathway signal protein [Comamonadaceae bacterium]